MTTRRLALLALMVLSTGAAACSAESTPEETKELSSSSITRSSDDDPTDEDLAAARRPSGPTFYCERAPKGRADLPARIIGQWGADGELYTHRQCGSCGTAAETRAGKCGTDWNPPPSSRDDDDAED